MAVIIVTKVNGQTREGYDQVLTAVSDLLKAAPGFIFHCAHPSDGHWMVYEVWQSKAEADRWFGKYVVPNLPHGIHPKRTYEELHSVLTATEKSFLAQ
jgi:hypothetical protein